MRTTIPFVNPKQRAAIEARVHQHAAAESALVAALEPLALAHDLDNARLVGLTDEGMVFDVPEPTP